MDDKAEQEPFTFVTDDPERQAEFDRATLVAAKDIAKLARLVKENKVMPVPVTKAVRALRVERTIIPKGKRRKKRR